MLSLILLSVRKIIDSIGEIPECTALQADVRSTPMFWACDRISDTPDPDMC